MRRFEHDMEKVLNTKLEHLTQTMAVKVICPRCQMTVQAPLGESYCPACGYTIIVNPPIL